MIPNSFAVAADKKFVAAVEGEVEVATNADDYQQNGPGSEDIEKRDVKAKKMLDFAEGRPSKLVKSVLVVVAEVGGGRQ